MGNPTQLELAVAEWVRAEYQFRYGPDAYRKEPTERFVRAERLLRYALTKQKSLGGAYLNVRSRPELVKDD